MKWLGRWAKVRPRRERGVWLCSAARGGDREANLLEQRWRQINVTPRTTPWTAGIGPSSTGPAAGPAAGGPRDCLSAKHLAVQGTIRTLGVEPDNDPEMKRAA